MSSTTLIGFSITVGMLSIVLALAGIQRTLKVLALTLIEIARTKGVPE